MKSSMNESEEEFRICSVKGCDFFATFREMCAFHLEKAIAKSQLQQELKQLREEKSGKSACSFKMDEDFY